MFRILSIVFFIFSGNAHAQDVASFNFGVLNFKGDTSWDARTGTPPIKMNDQTMLFNGLSTRHLSIETGAAHFRLSEYSYSLMSITHWDEKWIFMIRGQASLRNATEQVSWTQDALFLSGMVMVSRPLGESVHWSYSFGVLLPEATLRIAVLPVIGFVYDSPKKDYGVQISFPLASVFFVPTPDWKYGFGMGFENGAYLLQPGSSFRINGVKYLGQKRVVAAPFVRYQGLKNIALQLRLGFTFKSKTFTEDANYEETTVIDEKPGFFMLSGIALTL